MITEGEMFQDRLGELADAKGFERVADDMIREANRLERELADARQALATKMGIVRSMARFGPGPGTTAEQTLETIAEYARIVALAGVRADEPAEKETT
jgi:hypothetical protein